MAQTDIQQRLLQELLEALHDADAYPEVNAFRIAHEAERSDIDELVQQHLVGTRGDRYILTLDGLRACGSPEALAEIDAAAALIPHLQAAYRSAPGRPVKPNKLAIELGKSEAEVQRGLTLLRDMSICDQVSLDTATGFVSRMTLSESILDVSPSDLAPPFPAGPESGELVRPDRLLTKIEIDGYRPFRDFEAEPGDLTVIIGANATGKSSMFDFLRFVSRAVQDPLPPEIDERSAGKRLFHGEGAERITFCLTLDLGQRLPLQYEAEVLGPIGSPTVSRERLATTEPLREGETKPFLFLDFTGGRGVVRDQQERKLVRPEWTVRPNELALRRALDPTLFTLSRVHGVLSGWRFYSGFDVSAAATIRRPVPTEPEPFLDEKGGNLSAILMWLNHEHQAAWEELESHLRSAVPGFRSLNVKPTGGPGTVIGVWREAGIDADLTLADLSDGTLRFLCWAVLCLSPTPPTLLCIDEPELGLHPRVLPVLAGLFRLASARMQILIATHSPYFLSHFALDEIAVMRKEGGAARFVRPSSSKALREMVQDVGGEALTRLHLSDELETLP